MNSRMKGIALMLTLLAALPGVEAAAQWDKDVFSFRGRRALAEGKYATAIENFNILARLDTTDYWTFFFRGIAKYNLGDLRGAKNDFNTSVRLNPVFTNGYHYRAITLSRQGLYDKAFEDYEKAISLRPGEEGLYYSRGVTFFMSRQFDRAVEDFNRYIRKQPRDPSAYLNRGASLLFLCDTTAAVADYDKAIRLDRFDPEGYIRRGRLNASRGRYEDALKDMDQALKLDGENSFALFNRALMRYEVKDYIGAMDDLNGVLEQEPGNALTLYNRALIKAQVGDYEGALEDYDRVVAINPENVLVYFNRAAVFIETGRYQDALEDYDRAIALYPDFAKAYMNRSYVKNLLGRNKSSRDDYETARRKIREYKARNAGEGAGSFADTTKKYSGLIALDADFAKKDFNDEMLQYRDVDVKLRPLYKVSRTDGAGRTEALGRRYENPLLERFLATSGANLAITSEKAANQSGPTASQPDQAKASSSVQEAAPAGLPAAREEFLKALEAYDRKHYTAAMEQYTLAADAAPAKGVESLYKALYLMNRGALRAEMIDFIASIENSVQVLSMDENGQTRARVKDRVDKTYDYSEALADMKEAERIMPDMPYILFNLGNLYTLSASHIEAIDAYTRAIKAYPAMGDAYFNRALVQIYLKDKEKGCMDLSTAGELGVKEAYGIIKKYCEKALTE